MAQEHNVDLSKIVGSGADGRVSKEDVLRFVEQSKSKVADEERVPMSRMRKLIAEHMSLSRRTAADVSTFFEIDMSAVDAEREKVKDQHGDETYLSSICMCGQLFKACRTFPILNASIDGDSIVYKKNYNIGVAVALDQGLIVPVLKNADQKNILEIVESCGIYRIGQEIIDYQQAIWKMERSQSQIREYSGHC